MPKIEDLKAELLSLQSELASVQNEGRVLTDCWIAKAKPGSKKHKYPRLKSRKPMFNGKKTEYLSIQGSALADAEAAIARGKTVKQLNKRIKVISKQIDEVFSVAPGGPIRTDDKACGKPAGNVLENVDLLQSNAKSSKTPTQKNAQDWYTPPEIIALIRQVMKIDLDPASSEVAQQRVQATSYYTQAQDGLKEPWFGRVWLHPPTRGKTAKWINKLLTEYESGQVLEAIVLVRPSVGSKWFQKLTRFPVCFPDEPIAFINDQGQPQPRPKQGNAIFYLGQNIERFQQIFGTIGNVSSPSAKS